MAESKPFFMTNEKYKEGFVVSEYNGTWQLIAAKKGEDRVFEKWGEMEIGKDKTTRLPVSISLGTNPTTVIKKLLAYFNDSPDVDAPPF